MDLPVKERLRDRQARLNAAAEERGKALDKYGRGTALDGNDVEEGEENTKALAVRDEEDDYYNEIAQRTSGKKAAKAEYTALVRQAEAEGAIVRVVEEEGEDGEKRAIGYKIEKNKGLAPKRSKDVRNPRVKKRKKYEEKMKKLSSMRAVYKGGEGRGGYVSFFRCDEMVVHDANIENRVVRRRVSRAIWLRVLSFRHETEESGICGYRIYHGGLSYTFLYDTSNAQDPPLQH